MTTTLDSRHSATDSSEPAQFQLCLRPIVDCSADQSYTVTSSLVLVHCSFHVFLKPDNGHPSNSTIPLPAFLICADISVQHGDAVASPTLKNWPLFGQKFSKFGQSIQPHSHVSEIVSIFQTKAK